MTDEQKQNPEEAVAAEAKPKRAAKPKAAEGGEPAKATKAAKPGKAEAPAEATEAEAEVAAAKPATGVKSVGGPGADAKAIARFIRMSPRKARRVIDLIRGKNVEEARTILRFLPQRAAGTVLKVLESAVANAEHNKGLNRRDLIVKQAFADGGPTLKRFQPHAQGRAFPIKKRTSHITVVVGK